MKERKRMASHLDVWTNSDKSLKYENVVALKIQFNEWPTDSYRKMRLLLLQELIYSEKATMKLRNTRNNYFQGGGSRGGTRNIVNREA